MIPLKLSITNFLSYGSCQVIDLEAYGLICLSGKNGHGKSAFLDAITWALWGQARKISGVVKADEGLLHLGTTTMMVSLDFECNETQYRVRREYSIEGGKALSSLEFGILEKNTQVLRPLTDKTIRTTQAKIEATIGLDFETFINSAFLRQGQSHEFSKKSPKERKEILASILGLDRFENIRKLALEKAREAYNQKQGSATRIERLKNELQAQASLDIRVQTLTETLEKTAIKEAEWHLAATKLTQEMQAFAFEKAHAEKIDYKKQHIRTRIDELIASLSQESALFRRILRESHSCTPKKLEEERTQLQHNLQNMQFLAAKKIELSGAVSTQQENTRRYVQQWQETYKQELEKTNLQLQAVMLSLNSCEEKKHDLEKKKQIYEQRCISFEQQYKKLFHELEKSRFNEDSVALEKNLERCTSFFHTCAEKAKNLTLQLSNLEQKKQLVSSSPTTQCPLCDQQADSQTLLNKFEKQVEHAHHQLKRLSRIGAEIKKVITHDGAFLQELKKKKEQQKIIEVHLGELKKNKEKEESEYRTLVKELELIEIKKDQFKKELITIQQIESGLKIRLEAYIQDTNYKNLQNELISLNAQLEAIPYNPAQERHFHEQLQRLSIIATEKSVLFKEISLQADRKQSVHQKCSTARALKNELALLEKETSFLPAFQEKYTLMTKTYEELRQKLGIVAQEKEALFLEKGSLEAQLQSLKIKQDIVKQEEMFCKKYSLEEEEYTMLATIMSKEGIQALLIEDALPEIEQEANALLSQLTNNRAHITIDSLKDLKSGKTKETLDIKISDEVGIRPYELFSGGEAFRIDFALRIALSKLLSCRAGTRLQTLIIDEGFGSQDEEGLEHIIDALLHIQADFAKIIVVSHLSTLKEQFPVHFLVQKNAEGSTVHVIEHC